MGGGFGHFYHYAPFKIEYAIDRYPWKPSACSMSPTTSLKETRFLGGDDYSIADMSAYPWLGNIHRGEAYGEAATVPLHARMTRPSAAGSRKSTRARARSAAASVNTNKGIARTPQRRPILRRCPKLRSDRIAAMGQSLPHPPLVTRKAAAISARHSDGASPSGKAPVFGTGIRRFESSRPSQQAGRVDRWRRLNVPPRQPPDTIRQRLA